MNWNEDYYNGHTADLRGFISPAPPWMIDLGWEYMGFWIIVEHNELEAKVKGLTVVSQSRTGASIEVLAPPEELGMMGHVYHKLEETNLPLVLLSDHLYVVCVKGLLTKGNLGTTDLVGQLFLTNGPLNQKDTISYELPRRMIITDDQGQCLISKDNSVVKNVSFKARITGNTQHFDGHPLFRNIVQEHDDLKQEVRSLRKLSSVSMSNVTKLLFRH